VVVEFSKPEVQFVKAGCGPSGGPCGPGAGAAPCCAVTQPRGPLFNFSCMKICNRYGAPAVPAAAAPAVQTISVPSFATAMIPVTYQYQITRSGVATGETALYGEARQRVGAEISRQSIAEIAAEVARQIRKSGETAVEGAADPCAGLEKRVNELEGRIQRLEAQVDRILNKLPGK
jgi:hypothetical protein